MNLANATQVICSGMSPADSSVQMKINTPVKGMMGKKLHFIENREKGLGC